MEYMMMMEYTNYLNMPSTKNEVIITPIGTFNI